MVFLSNIWQFGKFIGSNVNILQFRIINQINTLQLILIDEYPSDCR